MRVISIEPCGRHIHPFDIGADVQKGFKRRRYFIIQVGSEAIPVHPGRWIIAQYGFRLRSQVAALVQVGSVDKIRELVGAPAGAQVHPCLRNVAGDVFAVIIVVGVYIFPESSLLCIIWVIRVQPRQRVGIPVHIRLGEGRSNAVIHQSFISQFHIVHRVQALRFPAKRGIAFVNTGTQPHFTCYAAAGGNEDNAIGAAYPEYRGRGGILQDSDRSHFIGVEGPDIIAGNPVDEDERIGTVGSSGAAQVHGGVIATWLSPTRLDGSQTRQSAGQGIGQTG